MSATPELSIVLPMYNERQGIETAIQTIRERLGDAVAAGNLEILCVDDGSRDGTAEHVKSLEVAQPVVRLIELSRNFGKEAAIAAGLAHARGRAVVVMDADLQHPPEIIVSMLRYWREGYEIVHARKRARAKESVVYRSLAYAFNALMGGASGVRFQGASDFKLLDRRVVQVLLLLPERERFFRGLVSWLGFRSTEVEFDVAERHAGETKWSTRQLIRYSLRNLLAFSSFPLKAVAAVGFGTVVFTALLSAWTLYRYLRGDALSGFTTVILLQLVLGSLLLTGVGIIALYVAQMFQELKGRPTFVVRNAPEIASDRDRALHPTSDATATSTSVPQLPNTSHGWPNGR